MKKLLYQWRYDLILFVILFLGYTLLGGYLAMIRGFIPGDALARMVSAWLVFSGEEVKLATIGFVWPPIPTLFILPLTLIPSLVQSWMAVVLVSAFNMAVGGMLLNRTAKLFDEPWYIKVFVVLIFATNPLIVMFGANGMSEAVLISFTLLAFIFLLRFWKTDRNQEMVFAGFVLGFLPLIRYEALLLLIPAGLLVLIQCWQQYKVMTQDEFRDYLEGRLIAFGALLIYPVFLWILFNWQMMENPFYFIANDRSALNVAEGQMSGYMLQGNMLASMQVSFEIFTGLFPIWIIIAIGGVFVGIYRKNYFLVMLSLSPIVVPLFQGVLFFMAAGVPLLRYFILVIPLSLITFLFAWGEYFKAEPNPINPGRVKALKALIMTGFVILSIFSGFSTVRMLDGSQYMSIEQPTWRGLISQEPIPMLHFRQPKAGLEVGEVLPGLIPEGKRILLDTYAGGYAVILGSGDPSMFLNYTSPDWTQALREPWNYVDYVLVPSVGTEGWLNLVNMEHPNLYLNGATWAEEVPGLPESAYGWKLFKVVE